MTRFVFIIPLVLMASAASAQQGHDACARDVARFCRAHMNDGDQVVVSDLSGLKAGQKVHSQTIAVMQYHEQNAQ